MAGSLGIIAQGRRLPDCPVPPLHRLRRPSGRGPGQEPAEVPVLARRSITTSSSPSSARSWALSGAWIIIVLFALLILAGVLDCPSTPGTSFGALLVAGHHHSRWRLQVVSEHLRGHKHSSPPPASRLPFFSYGGTALLHPAGGDGRRPVRLPADEAGGFG